MIRLVARTDHNAAEPVRVINQQVLDGGGGRFTESDRDISCLD